MPTKQTTEQRMRSKYHYITVHKFGRSPWRLTAQLRKDKGPFLYVEGKTLAEAIRNLAKL